MDFASLTEDGSISYPVTLRCTDKNKRPTITIASTTVTNPEDGTESTRYGRISTTVPLTLQNLKFDYSIIPDDQEEIRFREDYNRELIRISEEAEEVYRVFCGIGMKIK